MAQQMHRPAGGASQRSRCSRSGRLQRHVAFQPVCQREMSLVPCQGLVAQSALPQALPGFSASRAQRSAFTRCSTVARANAHDQEPWEFFSAREDPSIPGPSNTPAHEEDTELLYPPRHGLWRFTDTPGLDLQTLCRSSDIQQVYVILFGVGSRDTEGIYSLRAYNEVTGLPQETIIVFESEEDASRYAGLLEATMDHVPAVCSIPPQELLEFCRESGYLCRVEPCGSLLIPPDYNVRITDWERSMRLREGQFSVLESEPEPPRGPQYGPQKHHGSGLQVAEAPQRPAQWQPAAAAAAAASLPMDTRCSSLAKYHPSFTDHELSELKRRLESLLPPSEPMDASSSEWDLPPAATAHTNGHTQHTQHTQHRGPTQTDSWDEDDLTPPTYI